MFLPPDIASMTAGGLNIAGGIAQNAANKKIAREQMAFQERMSSTSWQRGVADMEAAGINPMLAVSKGGASSPGGASIPNQNIAGKAVSSAMDAKLMLAQLENLNAQRSKIEADTLVSSATARAIASKQPALDAESALYQTGFGPLLPLLDRINPFVNSAISAIFRK